jgi:hypothetical protein
MICMDTCNRYEAILVIGGGKGGDRCPVVWLRFAQEAGDGAWHCWWVLLMECRVGITFEVVDSGF